jgi:hypothetical protein
LSDRDGEGKGRGREGRKDGKEVNTKLNNKE